MNISYNDQDIYKKYGAKAKYETVKYDGKDKQNFLYWYWEGDRDKMPHELKDRKI